MTSSNKLVSIIIPVYNGANCIGKALRSVYKQTYREIEALIVDDGSTDGSGDVILRLAENFGGTDIVCKLFTQENRGIAMARNRGLREASGEYIMFMDQDDRLEADCVETLMDEAIKDHSDIVIGGVNKVSDKGRVLESWRLSPQLSWCKFRITAPWGRIFKKSLIDEYHLSFFDTKISEDLYFNILFLSHADYVKVVPYIGYNWVQSQNSESHGNWAKMSDERNPLPMLTDLHKQMGKSDIIRKDEMTFFFAKYLIWYLLFCSRGASHTQVKGRCEEVFAWLKKYYPDFPRYAWKSLWFPGGEQPKIRLCVTVTLMMYKIGILSFFMDIYRRI